VNHLIRAEIRKLTTTRMWIGLMLGGLALVALYVLVIGFTAGTRQAGGQNGVPSLSNPAAVRTVYGVPFEVGYLMPLILGITIICGEDRHRTLTPTFLACPRRSQVLMAKAIVAGAAGLVMGFVFTVFAAGLGAVVIAGRGYPVLLTSNDVPRMLALMVLGLGVWGVFGLGFGALLKNQVAAVVSAIALVTIVQGLLTLLLNWLSLESIAQYLPSNAARDRRPREHPGPGAARVVGRRARAARLGARDVRARVDVHPAPRHHVISRRSTGSGGPCRAR
jgi:ABC-type transport system involved in multi-copper enzyme maturation permease subunit